VRVSGGRPLTRRQLNRALLVRQMLLERAGTPLPRALERMGGLQAQYAPSMYIGLWSRLEGFERGRLTEALERRSVVQGTLMRSTIHLVSRRDYWPLALAVRAGRREWWLRTHAGAGGAAAMEEAARLLRERLAGGPLHRSEIEALIGRPRAVGVGLWIELVRVPPSGTWERRRADLYAAAERWVGPEPDGANDPLELLVRRYLAAFGPASAADVAGWAGIPPRAVAPALARMPLRRFRGEDGAELLDLPRAPLPDPETQAPVRFLPTWDAVLLVHARRTGVLPEEFRSRVFHTRNPHSVPTFLVDGAVAGAWRSESGRVELEPFRRLDAATRRALREEAEGLVALHG